MLNFYLTTLKQTPTKPIQVRVKYFLNVCKACNYVRLFERDNRYVSQMLDDYQLEVPIRLTLLLP